jgi:hypothetical protein
MSSIDDAVAGAGAGALGGVDLGGAERRGVDRRGAARLAVRLMVRLAVRFAVRRAGLRAPTFFREAALRGFALVFDVFRRFLAMRAPSNPS